MPGTNGGTPGDHQRRMDQMEGMIQGLITVAHEQQKTAAAFLELVKESRAEIQDLLELQKEHRIDIIALFAANKELRESMEKYFDPSGSGKR